MTKKEMTPEQRAKKSAYDTAYNRANYDRVGVYMNKADAEKMRKHAAARGESVNAFINRAIAGQLQRDSVQASAVEDVNDVSE